MMIYVMQAPFVLCRVFRKHRAGGSTFQGAVNLNGEQSALAISHDDFWINRHQISDIAGGGDLNTIHSRSAVSVELNVHITCGPAAPPLEIEPIQLVIYLGNAF